MKTTNEILAHLEHIERERQRLGRECVKAGDEDGATYHYARRAMAREMIDFIRDVEYIVFRIRDDGFISYVGAHATKAAADAHASFEGGASGSRLIVHEEPRGSHRSILRMIQEIRERESRAKMEGTTIDYHLI